MQISEGVYIRLSLRLRRADNTLLDLHNSSYYTQPHPIIIIIHVSFIRCFNWSRGYDVTANNCLRIIVLLQIMSVCLCAVQSTSNHNGSAFFRVIGERFYLFTGTKTSPCSTKKATGTALNLFWKHIEGTKYWKISL